MDQSSADAAPAVPAHLAVVMDGNGRWARSRGLPRYAGHRAGVRAARDLTDACIVRGIPNLTLFAFSSENWSRPEGEVGLLMDLFVEALERELDGMAGRGVRIRFIGDRSRLGERVAGMAAQAEERTATNTQLTAHVALAYGGRWDILNAARAMAAEHAAELAAGRDPGSLSEADLARHLSLADAPAPDLLIRTGGEHRISNFLIWDLAYAELYFSDALWPDFDDEALDQALAWFAGRERRFGRTSDQLAPQGGRGAC